jgi:hypothetical protein
MRAHGCFRTSGHTVTARVDPWIRRTTIGCVAMLALIAGTVSYLHMHRLVEFHGQPGWVAALTPLMLLLVSSAGLVAEPLLVAAG